MMKKLLIGILFLALISCETNKIETVQLDGAWLENSHKTDTLVFDTQNGMFDLNRGNEIRNGLLLPKYLSGPYLYEIKGDSINLRWTASSVGVGTNYFFNPNSNNDQIEIGNFFVDSLSNHVNLTFSKMP